MEKAKRGKLAELLVRLIKANKMTQSYFYSKVGIAKPYFYDILAGKVYPSIEVQFKMIEVLKPGQKEAQELLDLIAEEKDTLPADIFVYLNGNKEKYKLIREMMQNE